MLGPFSRAFLKQRDGGLDGTIERADRLATMLFSSTLLCVQTLAGTLVVAIVSLGVAMAIGAAFGDVDRITLAIVAVLMIFLLGLAMVPMLLEKSIARRHARGLDTARQEKRLQSVLAGLQRVPMLRLLQTMQWTLQSNLRSRSFTVIYIGGHAGDDARRPAGVRLLEVLAVQPLQRDDRRSGGPRHAGRALRIVALGA